MPTMPSIILDHLRTLRGDGLTVLLESVLIRAIK